MQDQICQAQVRDIPIRAMDAVHGQVTHTPEGGVEQRPQFTHITLIVKVLLQPGGTAPACNGMTLLTIKFPHHSQPYSRYSSSFQVGNLRALP